MSRRRITSIEKWEQVSQAFVEAGRDVGKDAAAFFEDAHPKGRFECRRIQCRERPKFTRSEYVGLGDHQTEIHSQKQQQEYLLDSDNCRKSNFIWSWETALSLNPWWGRRITFPFRTRWKVPAPRTLILELKRRLPSEIKICPQHRFCSLTSPITRTHRAKGFQYLPSNKRTPQQWRPTKKRRSPPSQQIKPQIQQPQQLSCGNETWREHRQKIHWNLRIAIWWNGAALKE